MNTPLQCFDFRVKDLLGYNCSDLMNKSLFDYHHAMDSEVIDQAYKNCKSSSHNLDVSQITPKLQVTW